MQDTVDELSSPPININYQYSIDNRCISKPRDINVINNTETSSTGNCEVIIELERFKLSVHEKLHSFTELRLNNEGPR